MKNLCYNKFNKEIKNSLKEVPSPCKLFQGILCKMWGLDIFMNKTFRPAQIFSEHMVLQQNVEIPVWGLAEDGSKVCVEFCEQYQEVIAEDGEWRVIFSPVTAGGPF